jgi:hypothetical protein
MPDYFTPTVIPQTFPQPDVSPLECLILSSLFDAEEDEEGIYLSTSEGPCGQVYARG